MKEMKKSIEQLKSKETLSEARNFLMSAKNIGGLKVVTVSDSKFNPDTMRKTGDYMRDKEESIVAVLAAVKEDKITFYATCGKAAVKAGVRAGDIIKNVTAVCGGKGGGKPESAMGGASNVLKLDDALATVDDFVAGKLNK